MPPPSANADLAPEVHHHHHHHHHHHTTRNIPASVSRAARPTALCCQEPLADHAPDIYVLIKKQRGRGWSSGSTHGEWVHITSAMAGCSVPFVMLLLKRWPATRVVGGTSFSNMEPLRARNGLWVKKGKNLVTPVVMSAKQAKSETFLDNLTTCNSYPTAMQPRSCGVSIGQVIFIHLCTF